MHGPHQVVNVGSGIVYFPSLLKEREERERDLTIALAYKSPHLIQAIKGQ